jgi:glycosyltransferase involved in cell wall biosynthesis
MTKKLKVIRVVTSSECVPWHLGNTLHRITKDFDVCVVGKNVSNYKNIYPNIEWVDININRNISPISDLVAIYNLCKLFLKYKPDIVHSIMPKAGLLTSISGFLCRVPTRIHTFTGQIWAAKTGIHRAFFKAIDRLIIKLNSICLTDSPSQSNFLYKEGITINNKPLPVLLIGSLSGVDISRFNKSKTEHEAKNLLTQLGITERDFIFGFIARKSFDKGAIDLIKAFSEVLKTYKNIKLLFVGPDESDGKVDLLLSSNPLVKENIFNIDKVNNHEVYLAITDVLCLPSYREGFGSVVIDAAAMGVPTIGTSIPGLRDAIVDNQTGILIEVGNVQELTIAMKKFIDHRDIKLQMGKNATLRVKEFFTADLLYLALKDLYLSASKNLPIKKI